MIRLKLKNRQAPTVDEAAKWRSTSFNTEFTPEELDRLITKHGADVLGAHYDDGVPTGKQDDSSAAGAAVHSREKTEPQKSFNPKAKWETPTGIYYYPLSWAKDEIFSSGVPFAGRSKYIYIYKIKDVSKRIDASELYKNGFIERAVLWASINKDLSRVLKDSGLGAGAAYNEIMAYHGGKATYGDPSKGREENILSAYKTYFSRAKEAIKTHFTRRLITATANPLGFDWGEIIETLVRDLPPMAGRGLNDMVSWDDKYLPSPVVSRQMWSDVARRVLKQLKIEDAIKGLESTIDAKNPKFAKALETVDNLIDSYISSTSSDQLLKKTELSTKADKPMPVGSIEKLFRADGKDPATVANMCFYIINNMMDRNVNKVTKYFISQGYEVFEDREGTGTIHTSEPYQGIYLTTRIAELVGVYLNKFRTGRMKGSYIPAKEMDPKLLRKLLSGEKGKAVVDQAFKYAKDHPEEFNMFLTYMFNNPDIPKDKTLADKIIKEADPERVSYYTIEAYITNFASLLTPEELEDRLSKIVGTKAKSLIDNTVNSSPAKIVNTIKYAVDNLSMEYGSKFNIDDYPTLKYLKDTADIAVERKKVDEFLTNMDGYPIDEIKNIFPIMLKEKTASGKPAELGVVVSNIVGATQFKNRPIEERMEFNEWLFDTYPQSWEDDVVIRSALSSMRYVRKEDDATPEAEEEFKKKLEQGFYDKLLGHWSEMKRDPELLAKLAKEREAIQKQYGKPQGVTTESRFKKLNRIGRYSMLR